MRDRTRSKRLRRRIPPPAPVAQNQNETVTTPKRAAIFQLPNELLGEIASYFCHPEDLLALARTSKALYFTLGASGADYMWKRLRAIVSLQAVPKPLPEYTELSWARFLFGPNFCCKCGRKVYSLPWSVSLGLHLCEKCNPSSVISSEDIMLSQHRLEAPQALLLLLSKNGIPNIQSLVPKLEDGILGYSRRISTFSFTFRRFDAYTSSKYWKKFEASLPRDPYRMDEVSRSAFLVTMARQMQQMQERDKYATTALRWCQQHRDWLYQIKGNISEETNNWCRVYGISHGVLLQCQAYRSILSLVKRDRIETVTKLLDSRKEELCFQAAAWQQREKEKASLQSYEETEKQIKALYNTLSTDPKSQRRQGFPCYKVFKTLPSVKSILQSSTTSPDHSKAQLKNPELKKVIGNDLDQWKERARNAVRLLLGYGDPSNKSGRGRNKAAQIWWDQPGKVAPELRRSSLFVCKMCNQLRKRQKRLGAMDFDGLCQHQCVLLDKASKDQPRWAPSNFEVATNPKATVERMLEILGVPGDDSKYLNALTTKQLWRCNTCAKSLCSMDWVDMVRHCQRHDTPDISLAEPTDDLAPGRIRPSKFPKFSQLVAGLHPEEAKKRQFVCAHCRTLAENEVDYRDGPPKDLNGMRSHLKAKHAISDVRDHDYYILSTTQQTETKTENKDLAMDIVVP